MSSESVKSGLIAGFVATCVLSFFMLVKASMGLLPQLDPIRDIVAVADNLTGADFPLPLGWLGHFFLGTVAWGLAYAWLEGQLPGSPIVKGLAFGFGAWLAMMVLFMPMAGEGFSGVAPDLWRGFRDGLRPSAKRNLGRAHPPPVGGEAAFDREQAAMGVAIDVSDESAVETGVAATAQRY